MDMTRRKLKLKVRPKLPAKIVSGVGLAISREGIVTNIGLDFTTLNPTNDVIGKRTIVFDPATGGYFYAPPPSGYNGTSGTALTIGTGTQTFLTEEGLAYRPGQRVRLVSRADPSNYMEGNIASYDDGTMAVSVTLLGPTASGTFSDWNIVVAGNPGNGDMLSSLNLGDVLDKVAANANLGIGAINAKLFGCVGDGVAFNESALNAALAYSAATGSKIFLPPGVYLVRTTKFTTIIGANRYYALDWHSGMTLVGTPGASIIKIADGQSSDAAPKDTNIFVDDGPSSNVTFYGVTFDCNGQNNPISPDRGIGVYRQYCCGAINITGNEAYVDDLYIDRCTFKNCAGTNNIVTGQCENGFAGPLGRRFYLTNCRFIDNGLDTNDHSSVYAWGMDVWAVGNDFLQNSSLDATNKNWVTFEIHGADSYYLNNHVDGYFRLCWISANFTQSTKNVHVAGNIARVRSQGPSVFRELSSFGDVTDVHIYNNDITLTADASPVSIKSGIDVVTLFSVFQIYIHGNKVRAEGTGYNSAMVQIASSTSGQANTNIFVTNNTAIDTVTGVYARINTGGGYLDDIHSSGNHYINMGTSSPTDLACGCRFQADSGADIGFMSSVGDKFISRDGAGNFDWGVLASGNLGALRVDGCDFINMANYIAGSSISISSSGAVIGRRLGKQICSGTAAPTSGTWLPGEEFYNLNPTQARNISHWQFDGSVWRAHGIGFGTTAARPTLVNADFGYAYMDADLSKIIYWSGSGGWYV